MDLSLKVPVSTFSLPLPSLFRRFLSRYRHKNRIFRMWACHYARLSARHRSHCL